ncbi:MAG: hypothetical protein HY815_15745 [Candidatus Riflebacteria bacterium]|nr:hypothetical protein [Candidatus Riflebacteria bacterium]
MRVGPSMSHFEHLFKPSFPHDLIKLPSAIQKKVTKAVDFLRQDPRHPSLQVKKVEAAHEVWETRVDRVYRLPFTLVGRGRLLLECEQPVLPVDLDGKPRLCIARVPPRAGLMRGRVSPEDSNEFVSEEGS